MNEQLQQIIDEANREYEKKQQDLFIQHQLETVRSVFVWHYKNEQQKFEDAMIDSIGVLVDCYIEAEKSEVVVPTKAYKYHKDSDIMSISFASYSAAFDIFEYLDNVCSSVEIIGVNKYGSLKYNVEGDEDYDVYMIFVYNFYEMEYCGGNS